MKKIMTANKKVLSLILALTMCVTMLMPLSATAVAADNTSTSNDTSAQSTAAVSTTTADRKAINLGSDVIHGYDSTNNSYDHVYYGVRDGKGVKWRVLDDETLDEKDGFFLLAENSIAVIPFINYCTVGSLNNRKNNCWVYANTKRHNEWMNSSARVWCRSFTEQITSGTTLGFPSDLHTITANSYNRNKAAYDANYNTFSDREKATILSTTKSDKNYLPAGQSWFFRSINLSGEKVFFLSASEATDAKYGFDQDANRKDAKKRWMTRSPATQDLVYSSDMGNSNLGFHGLNDSSLAVIFQDGYISDGRIYSAVLDRLGQENHVVVEYYTMYTNDFDARPAMNISKDNILFTSVADGSLETGFSPIADYSGSDWKLTLKTNDAFDAELSNTNLSEDGITVTHPALNSFSTAYNKVTAMLTNSNGEIVAYGALDTADTSATTSTLPFPDGLREGKYTLTLQAEQWNGANKTNYASDCVTKEISVAKAHSHDGHKFTMISSEEELAAMTEDSYGFLIADVTVDPDKVYIGHLCLNGFDVKGTMKVQNFALYDDDADSFGTLENGLHVVDGTLTLHGGNINGDENGYAVTAEDQITIALPGVMNLNGTMAAVYLKDGAQISAKGIARPTNRYTVKLESETGVFCTDWNEELDAKRYFSGADGTHVVQNDDTLTLAENVHNTSAHPVCGAVCTDEDSHPVITEWTKFTGKETELTSGNYYLDDDITLDHAIAIRGDVNLCLNGKMLLVEEQPGQFYKDAMYVHRGMSLNICDCSQDQTGKICGAENVGNVRCVAIGNNAECNLYGGTLSNANWVVNPEQDAVFRMYGGTISDADLGVYNFGNMYMYGGTIKRCRIGILGYAQTELYPDSLITDCTYGTDLGGSNRSAKLGGTIRNCDIGFTSGTLQETGVVENCRIGGERYVELLPGSIIRNCTEYGLYARGAVMSGGTITGCGVGIYLDPNKYGAEQSLLVSGSPVISGNKQANVAVYSKLNSEGKSEKNVQAIYVDEDGLSEAAEIPVRVITKDGDFDSYATDSSAVYTFSGKYPAKDYSKYFQSDVDSSIVVYDKETQQLAIAPLNIGTPATDRDLCLLRYDANGGSGSMNLDQLEDSQLIDGEWYVHFNTATNGDGRLHANQFTAPEGKKFVGWNTEADGSGITYTDQAVFRMISTASDDVNGSDKQMVLYAQWEDLPRVTVSLDANGGAVEPNDKTVIYTGTYGELPVPTREGYDFEGWFTQKEDGEKVEDTTVVATTEEHTLYAHWTIQVYDVTLSSGEGYTATGATSAEYSCNYEFEVQIAKGYSRTQNYRVLVNGSEVTAASSKDDCDKFQIQNVKGAMSIVVEGVADITPPEAELTIGTSKYNAFMNRVTFGLFFKKTQTVHVTASDLGSGLKSVEYLLADQAFEEKDAVSGDWSKLNVQNGNTSFNIDANKKAFVYVRVSDESGNVQIINSDGVVVYTDAEAITEAMNFTRLSQDDVQFAVQLNGNEVKNLYLGDQLIDSQYYSVSKDGEITLKNSYLSGLAAGEYTVRVTYDPLGETYTAGDEPAMTSVKLVVAKAERTIDYKAVDTTYNGKTYAGLTYENRPQATVIEYKVKGAADDTYTKDVPMNAGSYTVRISTPEDADYNAKQVSGAFTIKPKQVTINGTTVETTKVYDGTTEARLVETGTLSDNYDGKNLVIVAGKASYENKNVGPDKQVTFTGFALDGSAAANYVLNGQPESTTADITAKELTITGLKVKDKQYDGKKNAEIDRMPALAGVVTGDNVQLVNGIPTFDSEKAGKDIAIHFTDFVLFGDDEVVANYRLTQPSGMTASILEYVSDGSEYSVNSNDWINTEFVVTAKEGYALSRTDLADGEWTDQLSEQEETKNGTITFYVKNTVTGVISTAVTENYKIDKTIPVGEAKLNGRNAFQTILSKITFGLFFNEDVTVELSASDDASGIKSVMYYKADHQLTEEEVQAIADWTEYSELKMEAKDMEQFIIYVRMEDNAGNVSYIGSDGAIFDTTAPEITGVENGKTYYVTKKFTISDQNLASITVNGETVDGTVTLEGDTETTYVICATDKAGNVTEYTIVMKPISSITDTITEITVDNAKSSDTEVIRDVRDQLRDVTEAFDEEESTEAEWDKLQDALTNCEELENRIAAAKDASEKSEITEVKEITDETVKVEDEDALKDAEKALEEALKDYDGNYTESEREELEKQLENVKDALTAIDNAKKATEEIEQLPNVDDLKHSDKESVDRVKEIYDNLTENEKSMLEEDTRSKMNSLVKQMEELEKISYAPSIIEGAGQIWKAGSDTNAKFRSNAEFEEFVKVLVDGKVLDASKYTVSAGSTVVELKADYLNTLSAGEHTLSIVSENGTASTMFTIEKKAALDNAKNTSVNSPKTGDSNGFIWWFVVLFAGVGMMIITLAVHEKKKRSMK